MSQKAQSIEEIYASYQNLDKVYNNEERKKMDKDLSKLPIEVREKMKLQIDRIGFSCKKLLG